MINLVSVGRRAPVDVDAVTAGVFCTFGNNFQTAAPNDEDAHDAGVGAVFFYTHAELVERGRPTNNGIQELNRDARAQLVYVDPVKAHASAKGLRDTASHLPSGSAVAVQFTAIADQLDEDANICKARQKGRPPAEVDKEINFYTSFHDFKSKWDDFYDLVLTDHAPGSETGKPIADAIDSYDAEYRKFLDGFAKLGGTLSVPAPPKSVTGDVLPDVTGKGASAAVDSFTSLLKWGLVVALVIGGISLLSSARHAVA